MGLLSGIKTALGGSALGGVAGTIGGAALMGGLGYAGVRQTNRTNESIASARNAMEVEEAAKAREFSADQAEINRQFQAEQIGRQIGFQERMSNSAIQRRMADMKKAGINPLLAARFEASSPGGGAATGAMPATAKANAHGYEAKNQVQGAMDSIATAVSLMKEVNEVDRIKAHSKQLTAQAGLTGNLESISNQITPMINDGFEAIQKILKEGKQPGLGAKIYKIQQATENAVDKTIKEFKQQSHDTGSKLGRSLYKLQNMKGTDHKKMVPQFLKKTMKDLWKNLID